MGVALNILVFLFTVAAMEGAAWAAHKYLMHGPMWFLHKSHHVKDHGHVLELNDWFAVLFSGPAVALIFVGLHVWPPALPVGLGITAYGVIYFIFHDMIVHQRIKIDRLPRSAYLERITQAHRLHHHVTGKHGGVSFGFLVTPPVAALKEQLQQKKMDARAASR